jgi:hypothetical protein
LITVLRLTPEAAATALMLPRASYFERKNDALA